MYEQNTCNAYGGDSSGLGGFVLCLVIFLILIMLFRGVRGRQECVIYTTGSGQDAAPQVVAYTEKQHAPAPARDAAGQVAEAWAPAGGAGATTTYAPLD